MSQPPNNGPPPPPQPPYPPQQPPYPPQQQWPQHPQQQQQWPQPPRETGMSSNKTALVAILGGLGCFVLVAVVGLSLISGLFMSLCGRR
jgi:hypothetical protein